MRKEKIKIADQKALCASTGNCCSMCRKLIVIHSEEDGWNFIGEFAHIRGENPGSARYTEDLSHKEKIIFENIIVLCPSCHTTIDKNRNHYTPEILIERKKEHLLWVAKQLQTGMLDINFAELEIILKYLIDKPYNDTSSIDLLPVTDKIKKNNLDSNINNLIKIGMMQSTNIEEYLNKNPDPHFNERLSKNFIDKYLSLKKTEMDTNNIFLTLLNYASNGHTDFKYQAAGLAVVTYLFELCEIFEK